MARAMIIATVNTPQMIINAGDELVDGALQRDIARDPVFDPLIDDNGEQRNYRIQHIFLLSAARRRRSNFIRSVS